MTESFQISFKTDFTPITIFATQNHIIGLKFDLDDSTHKANKLLQDAKKQVCDYFKGKRQTFDLALKAEGTEFQQSVWTALKDTSYGQTVSYKQLSEHLGDPKSVRAVAKANGSNPIPLLIPCHRIVASNGSLTGYLGGLPLKQKLLELESGQQQLELF